MTHLVWGFPSTHLALDMGSRLRGLCSGLCSSNIGTLGRSVDICLSCNTSNSKRTEGESLHGDRHEAERFGGNDERSCARPGGWSDDKSVIYTIAISAFRDHDFVANLVNEVAQFCDADHPGLRPVTGQQCCHVDWQRA